MADQRTRARSPEFTQAPLDLPAWFTKCMKLLRDPPDEAREEIARMFNEALEKREKVESAAQPKKAELRSLPTKAAIFPVARPKPAAVPLKSVSEPPSKKMRASPKRPEERSASPDLSTQPELSRSKTEPFDTASSSSLEAESGAEKTLDDLFKDPCSICLKTDEKPGNGMLECSDCRKFFHQLCHKPPAVTVDPSDPRLVWYCEPCKNKKTVQPTATKVAPIVPPIPVKPKTVPFNPHMIRPTPSVTQNEPSAQPFKRQFMTPTAQPVKAVNPATGSGSLGGLALLAGRSQTTKPANPDKPEPKRAKLIEPTAKPKKG